VIIRILARRATDDAKSYAQRELRAIDPGGLKNLALTCAVGRPRAVIIHNPEPVEGGRVRAVGLELQRAMALRFPAAVTPPDAAVRSVIVTRSWERKWVKLVCCERRFPLRGKVLNPAMIHKGDGEHALPAHARIGGHVIIHLGTGFCH
jgi:hypothetical protein